jgi:hypothetical protein
MRMLFVLMVVPFALLAAGLATSVSVHADEGMWVFNNLPLDQLKARYGFEPLGRALEFRRRPLQ